MERILCSLDDDRASLDSPTQNIVRYLLTEKFKSCDVPCFLVVFYTVIDIQQDVGFGVTDYGTVNGAAGN